MYRPLPNGLTIKNSPIEGLGLFSNIEIPKNSFIGVTHIRDEQFENKYIRTPLGGFYNHSNDPTVVRMVGYSWVKRFWKYTNLSIIWWYAAKSCSCKMFNK